MSRSDSVTWKVGDAGAVHLSCNTQGLQVAYDGSTEHVVFVALRWMEAGSTIVPYSQGYEGSTVFLPFGATRLYGASAGRQWTRFWGDMAWGEYSETPGLSVTVRPEGGLQLTLEWQDPESEYEVAVWVKDLRANDGWGDFIGCCDPSVTEGWGDRSIESYYRFSPEGLAVQQRFGRSGRECIYELFVRLFGNVNETRKCNGTLAENGCGKFRDVTSEAITQIAGMGFTHVWLMGVVRHATTTAYPEAGLAADQTDLMKGLAGSPYAISDYFDVSPDLAVNPTRRLDEFKELVGRIHNAGLQVLVDFVGNHVARSYGSTVRPELSFGEGDDPRAFFDVDNNFFYLQASDPGGGPPLRLPSFDRTTGTAVSPTCAVLGDCDGLFGAETSIGRVTGNNSVTWSPSIYDWYETVKLNYGFDFAGRSESLRHFPYVGNEALAIPDTWLKMDAVFAYWQQAGVDGFRCDMAHMMPPEFWKWAIARARSRDEDAFFMAEAYNDFLVVPTTSPEVQALGGEQVFQGLLHAGFNAVYGHDAYRTIKGLYDGGNWANDLDRLPLSEYVANHSVYYAENHDEVRLATPHAWSGLGSRVGRVASAVLFLRSQGPVLFYNGQEVGEPAIEAEGFSGADGRTTLFDYWSMSEFVKWVNGGRFDGARLSEEQQDLRSYYARLIALCREPAFAEGRFFGLNESNLNNREFGSWGWEAASGHWLYAFLRYHRPSRQRFLVTVNFHPNHGLPAAMIEVPSTAWTFLEWEGQEQVRAVDRLNSSAQAVWRKGSKLQVSELPPLSVCAFSLEAAEPA